MNSGIVEILLTPLDPADLVNIYLSIKMFGFEFFMIFSPLPTR